MADSQPFFILCCQCFMNLETDGQQRNSSPVSTPTPSFKFFFGRKKKKKVAKHAHTKYEGHNFTYFSVCLLLHTYLTPYTPPLSHPQYYGRMVTRSQTMKIFCSFPFSSLQHFSSTCLVRRTRSPYARMLGRLVQFRRDESLFLSRFNQKKLAIFLSGQNLHWN